MCAVGVWVGRERELASASAATAPHRAVADGISAAAIASSASGRTLAPAGTSLEGAPNALIARSVPGRSRSFATPASANTPARTNSDTDTATDKIPFRQPTELYSELTSIAAAAPPY